MEDKRQLIVVTDLDGTLLDHHSYRFEAALPALRELEQLQIPVVLNTSKTLAELTPLLEKLNLDFPFMVENGAAVYWPKSYFPHLNIQSHCLGAKRSDILVALNTLKKQFSPPLQGFADWDLKALISHTGLSAADAALALQRDYSEPLLWQYSDDDYQRLANSVSESNLQLLKGGRFVHVVGQSDKGVALTWLKQQYQTLWSAMPDVIALGDGGNDVAMLEIAEYPVVIRSPQNDAPPLSEVALKRCVVPEGYGPVGWNSAILTLLQEFGLSVSNSLSSKEHYYG